MAIPTSGHSGAERFAAFVRSDCERLETEWRRAGETLGSERRSNGEKAPIFGELKGIVLRYVADALEDRLENGAEQQLGDALTDPDLLDVPIQQALDELSALRDLLVEAATSAGIDVSRETVHALQHALDRIISMCASAREAELRSRVSATEERSRNHARFLLEASKALSSSLELETTCAKVAQLAVPSMADWCAVDLRSDNGAFRRIAVAHANPLKAAAARGLEQEYEADPYAVFGTPMAVATGRATLHIAGVDALQVAIARDEEHLAHIRELGLESAMLIPLSAHGRRFGAIVFASAMPDRCYGDEDLRVAKDFAQRAAFAIAQARLYREAQEANRLKDEFLATLSHELRTPLAVILGWVQVLRTRPPEEGLLRRAVEAIERNATMQSQLVNDVLDVSRIITGKLGINPRPTELVPLLQSVCDIMRPTAESKGVNFVLSVRASIGTLAVDSDRIQQVLWNLLSNAVKFTSDGGRVEVSVDRTDTHVVLEVTDTGCGIRRDFLPFVFDRFRQGDSTTTRVHGGLGLGLSVVKHLVEAHGGVVAARSEGEGLGATFSVHLPVRLASDTPSISPPSVAPPPHIRLDGIRVLLVDDDPDARELLALMLGQHGAQTRVAGSAQEGLEALFEFHPDVLVSDIGMPNEDGYALLRKARAAFAQWNRWIPAVALTAYASAEDAKKAIAAGFQVHVTKPVDFAKLISTLSNLQNAHRS